MLTLSVEIQVRDYKILIINILPLINIEFNYFDV